MNPQEYEALIKLQPITEIKAADLTDRAPRTLLMGGADAANPNLTMHIYLSEKGNLVRLVLDDRDCGLVEFSAGPAVSLQRCNPREIFSDQSDFEFCSRLFAAGVLLPLTPSSPKWAARVAERTAELWGTNKGIYFAPTANMEVVLNGHPEVRKLTTVVMNHNADAFGLGSKLRSPELVERLNGILAFEIERGFPTSEAYDRSRNMMEELGAIPQKVADFVKRYFELDSWEMPSGKAAHMVDFARGVYNRRVGEVLQIKRSLNV